MPYSDIILPFLLTAVASYLIGSVSFSIIFTRLFANTDIREHGSGNAGTTNVLRTAGVLPAVLTFLCDFFKCVAAIGFALFIFHFFGDLENNANIFSAFFISTDMYITFIKFCAGLFCALGHLFPIYFGFKGGKGVTTICALLLMINWQVFIISVSIFIILVIVTRVVSFSVLMAAISIPVATFAFTMPFGGNFVLPNTLLAFLMTVILFITHRSNIRRILNGTETRITKKKKEGD